MHADWHDLLDDERIQVVDVAYPPDQQLAIVEEACTHPHVKDTRAPAPVAANYNVAQPHLRADADHATVLAHYTTRTYHHATQ